MSEDEERTTVGVKALTLGSPRVCTITHWYNVEEHSYSMRAQIDGLPTKEVQARDAFACLCEIREHLRAHDTILLCGGARLDAFPSRMSRDMGGGFVIYVTTMGQQTREEDMVGLLDEAPADKIASVEDQRAFHKRWLDQLGSSRGAGGA